MGFSRVLTFMISISLASALFAEDANVQSVSEGACWVEQGEILKVASFNDKEVLAASRDEIEYQVDSLLNGKKNKAITTDLTLHCGGYGSSLVMKTEIENRPVCLWLKFTKGKLGIRSLGGNENPKNEMCDGYKWGELIVGLKSADQKALLESEHFHSIVKSVSVISATTVKVVLNESFIGKEDEAISELKKQIQVKYIELNLFQHPVGETTPIK